MCGICGQFNFADATPVEASAIQRMMDTIVHRGPDDEGCYVRGQLGLGFRRLAILDLSPAGHQPMSDPEQNVWIVFNGEIYNFRELRAELEARGHVFKSQCDTEVIVMGYKEWGEEVLGKLNGMFGLAIWDTEKRKLVVARDPMGIKPIYYATRSGRLYFGSEIRPVLTALGESPSIDPTALNLFLRYRYTPAPRTLYQGISKLAPGEKLVVSNGVCRSESWYRFRPEPYDPQPKPREAVAELLELYKRALKRHLISDVPVGLLLSGGVDSGLLLGLMGLNGSNWPTFTVGYGTSFKDDELRDAAETARLFSAKHTEVRLDRSEFERALPRIVSVLEEPVASSSIVPMYFVCERARQDVKVALVGQGPDELFGGYTRHLGVRYGNLWRSLPEGLRAMTGSAVEALPRQAALKRACYALGEEDRLRRYQRIFSIEPGEVVDALFQPDVLPPGAGDSLLSSWEGLKSQVDHLDELGGFQLLELRSSLPDELLMYADKLSMAHALEVRVPYLDRELVEHVQRLDSGLKVRRGQRKWVHKAACRRFLPQTILNRKKRGFAVNVVDDWFQNKMKGKMQDYLVDNQSAMYSLLEQKTISRLMNEHSSGKADHHKILFSLVVFEEWLRNAAGSKPKDGVRSGTASPKNELSTAV